MVPEIPAGAGDKCLEADIGDQLLQYGRTLRVSDAVEVLLGRLQVRYVGHDRMGGGQLVLDIGPGLAVVGEVHPGRIPVRGAVNAQGAHVVGKGLLEPEIVPPLHGDEVAEPHVRHFVHQGVGTGLVLGISCPGREDVVFGEGDQPGVLHGAEVVLRHKGLVVFAPRIRIVKEVVEEAEPPLRQLKEVPGVKGSRHGAAAVQGQRDLQCGAVLQCSAPVVLRLEVRPRQHRRDVGGHPLCRREVPAARCGVARELRAAGLGAVGGDLPVGRGHHMEGELSFEVRLFKVCEHPSGVGRFVLGVEVALAVGRIEEAVHAFAGGAVQGCSGNSHLVFGLQVVLPDAGAVHHVGDGKPLAVQEDAVHLAADEVQESRPAGFPGRKRDDTAARVARDLRILRLADVEGHVIAVGGDQG
ncbi:hypothetical protein D9M72_365740 [compost metagenome]